MQSVVLERKNKKVGEEHYRNLEIEPTGWTSLDWCWCESNMLKKSNMLASVPLFSCTVVRGVLHGGIQLIIGSKSNGLSVLAAVQPSESTVAIVLLSGAGHHWVKSTLTHLSLNKQTLTRNCFVNVVLV